MPDSSAKDLIKFTCSSCGAPLRVDRALAGTEGACQSCGTRLIVPPLGLPTTLSEKQAAPVAVQPRVRSAKKKRVPDSPFELVKEEGNRSTPAPSHARAEGIAAPKPDFVPQSTKRRGRSVSPATVLSQSHEDKKNVRAFITITIVTCLVACLALGVYYFMVYGQH